MKIRNRFIHKFGDDHRLFLFLLLTFSICFTGIGKVPYYHPVIDYLNVYQRAGYESPVIRQLMHSDLMQVCRTKDGWSYIVISGRPDKGYVVSKFIARSDYSPGKLNKYSLFSSGNGLNYQNGMSHYQSLINRNLLPITIGYLIISVFMGVLLFKIFHKIKRSEGEGIFSRTGKLSTGENSISVIHWYVIIGVMESLHTIFVIHIFFPIAMSSFDVEFSVIASFLLWILGTAMIPVQLPSLLKRLGYQW